MQSNADRLCLLIPFTSAPNTGQDRNQVFPDAGHVDYLTIGAKKPMHYMANNEDIRLKIGTNTTLYFKCIVQQDLC